MVLIPMVSAASISVSQAGADSGTVMKGTSFTVSVSGLSSTGTVALSLPSGFSTSESTTKTFSEGTTSVSWTTIVADQKLTAQTIHATITTGGSPENVETSSFDVVLPPSFVASASPTSFSTTGYNGTYYANVTFSVQNWGETIAKDVVATLSRPSGLSLVSGYSDSQSIGTITGGAGGSGESKGISWRFYATNTVSGNLQIILTSSNTETLTTSIPFSLSFYTTTTTVSNETGSTGPSGGSQTSTTVPVTSQNWTAMTTGNFYALTGITSDIGFTSINLSVKNNVSNARLTVTKLLAKPSYIAANVPGTAYKYIEVSPVNLADSSIETAKIRFVVEKWWMDLNKFDKTGISLYRYNNGSWRKLDTSIIGEAGNYFSYESSTPGFSTFAIVAGAAGSAATTTTVTGSGAETGEETAATTTTISSAGDIFSTGAEGGYGSIIIILLVIMIIGSIAFLKKDEIKKQLGKIKSGKKEYKPKSSHSGEHKENDKKQ